MTANCVALSFKPIADRVISAGTLQICLKGWNEVCIQEEPNDVKPKVPKDLILQPHSLPNQNILRYR
jgi:hypothetical protein